ncbi:hypothetical protein PoB_007172200 [Plakobranchus ocellatus]|uniref:Uncharacterized protein n=1 Tax=Plakobranchus ocellatus TaxID=259542 RepID=A0AAV4DM84_9GAST|nr:hypothetical protein PoB_007172200 [Plakobranchus ocellatus]
MYCLLATKRHYRQPTGFRAMDYPQHGDLWLSGPSSGLGAGVGARTRDRRIPTDNGGLASTVPPTFRHSCTIAVPFVYMAAIIKLSSEVECDWLTDGRCMPQYATMVNL